MHSCDTQFANAVHLAVNGNASALVAILRSDTIIGPGEREALASIALRCAELARGDIGGAVGRTEIAAGHPKVRKAIERLDELLANDIQLNQAKGIVAEEQGISKRIIENYRRITKEREQAMIRAIK